MKEQPVISSQNKTVTSSYNGHRKVSFFKPVFQPKLSINQPNDIYEQEADRTADRVMRMKNDDVAASSFFNPSAISIHRKCAHCEEEEKKLHRKEKSNTATDSTSSIENYVHSISGGSEINKNDKQFFESRIGYDFSQVRLHTDSIAAKSAQSVNALAYTTGNNIIFNTGQYSPGTDSGKRLLAHELTHVVQQNKGVQTKIQRECYAEGSPNRDMAACPEGSQDVGRQAQGQTNTRDARANGIITASQNTSTSMQDRALQVVNDIICTYMPTQAQKVRKIFYDSAQMGLHTRSVGSGRTAQGNICVGDDFVTNTNNSRFARRVLQVAHELQHIEQYRTGFAGGTRGDEREFLAFYDEGLADEFIGTGRMSDASRKNLIDGAIGYYYCLDAALQTQYASRLQTLLTRRQTVNGTAGNASTNAPTSCRRQ